VMALEHEPDAARPKPADTEMDTHRPPISANGTTEA
jgi:hypothetical protein